MNTCLKFIIIFIYFTILLSCNNSTENKPVKNESKENKQDEKPKRQAETSPVNFNSLDFNFVSQLIHLNKDSGIDFSLQIPEGYKITVAYQGMNRPRFMAKSPDGKLITADMINKEDNKKGVIIWFKNWNDKTKTFESTDTLLKNLHNPNQAAFHTFDGKDYFFVAETEKLTRYDYTQGTTFEIKNPKVIATFPDYGLSYKYGGWHLTRSLAFHNNKVYVSVGSSCNACIEKEKVRATILEMNIDGGEQKIYSSGMRNAVGIDFIGDALYATNMGEDKLGEDRPEDQFLKVERDKNYGWPFYYQYQNTIYENSKFTKQADSLAYKKGSIPLALCGFKAHSAPLGFEFLNNFEGELNNSILVCLHGPVVIKEHKGYNIVKINATGYQEIIKGFLQGKLKYGRPCDILQWDSSSFFFTDDHNGILYYVWKPS